MTLFEREDLNLSDLEAKTTPEEKVHHDIGTYQQEVSEGILIILSGPSGVGKNEMMKRISKAFPQAKKPRSKTTREPRPSEYNEKGELISQYDHISLEEFQHLIDTGALLEYNRLEENGQYYGTSFEQVEAGLNNKDIMIKEIEVKGRKTAVEKLPEQNVHSIFLSIANPESLRDRIKARGDEMPETEIDKRVANAFKEIEESSTSDEVITSIEGDIEATFQLIKTAIEKVISQRRTKMD